MASRDLRFNIFANDRASAAFNRISAAADNVSQRITRLNASRARVRVEADTSEIESKIAKAQAALDALERKRTSPTIDADIRVFEAKIAKAQADLVALNDQEASPEVDLKIAKAAADIERFREKIDALNRQRASPEVEADIAQAQAKLSNLQDEMGEMERNGVEIDARFDTSHVDRKIAQVKADIAELAGRKADINIDVDVRQQDALQDMASLQRRIDRLDAERADIDVELNSGPTAMRIEALRRQLENLRRESQTPLIRLHQEQVRNEIQQLERQLAPLRDRKIDISVEVRGIEREIGKVRAQIEALDKLRATPEIDAQTAKAQAKLALLERQLAGIRNREIDIRINRDSMFSLLGALNDMRHGMQNALNSAGLLVRNLRQVALPTGIAAAIPVLASLGAALQTASQAAALAPAGMMFLGAAVGTLSIAFHGLTDAIGPRGTEAQIKKADLAMSRLGENAQKMARVILGLQEEWNGLKNAVQDAFFANLSVVFENLATTYIPLLQRGFVGMAESLNLLARDFAMFFGSLDTQDDLSAMFIMWRQTMDALRPGIMNIVEAFMDLAVVGSSFLPQLIDMFSDMTGRFQSFIAIAREDGSLALWIAQGVNALDDLFSIIGNIGGSLAAIFDAAQRSGAGFGATLGSLTSELESFLKSGEGQAGLISLFEGIQDLVNSLLPGIRSLFQSASDAISALQPSFGMVGSIFANLSEAISPALVILSGFASFLVGVLGPAINGLLNAMTPIAPMVIAMAVGFRAFAGIATLVAGLGTALTGMAAAAGAASMTMTRSIGVGVGVERGFALLGTTLQRVSAALPLIGAALVAGWAIWDSSRSKADEYAKSAAQGSMTVEEAIQAEVAQLERQAGWYSLTGDFAGAAEMKQRALADATNNVQSATRDYLSTLDPLARAQAEVNLMEDRYLQILRDNPASSREVEMAAGALRNARDRLTVETQRNTDANRTNTESLVENANQVAAAANADVALERARLQLEQQTTRTNDVLRNHTASSVEGREAVLSLTEANLQVADSARRKAEADNQGLGAAQAAEAGARAYETTLMDLAASARGPVRDALLQAVANLASTRDGSNDAALAARGLTADVERIPPSAATTVTTPGLDAARTGVQGLASDVNALTDRRFVINAEGQVTGYRPDGGRGTIPIGDGYGYRPEWQFANGGVLPGYTPGRDVHLAALSGGEAVMRPEWTRAVGSDYIYAANAVARAGGVGAIRNWIQSGSPTGAKSAADIHEYAAGGVARNITGQVNYKWNGPSITDWFDRAGAAIVRSMGMMGIGQGSGPGGVGWMMTALRSRFPGLALHSGFRPGAITATGNQSYHSMGRAVDVPPRMDVFNWIKGTYGANSKEIIFSPAGAGQIWNGRPHMYTGVTRANHFDHVHWAYDQGGVAKGKGFMFKNVLRPERVLGPEMTKTFDRLVDYLRGNPQGGMQLPVVQPAPTVLRAPRLDLNPLLGEIANLRAELRSRPQTVVNQTIDGNRNPVETGRAAALAMRLGRPA